MKLSGSCRTIPNCLTSSPGPYQFTIKEIEPKYYSGLQVTKDPGVWVVWTGCFLMMAGFYLTFFLSHRRIWVRLTEKGGETWVEIAGSSHRDRAGFEKEFEKMIQALREESEREISEERERPAMISTKMLTAVTFLYLLCTVLYFNYLAFRSERLGKVAAGASWITLLIHTAAISLALGGILPDGHRPRPPLQHV